MISKVHRMRQHILVYVNETLRSEFPSGIQRVVRKIATHLPEFAEVQFVTWDYAAGRLCYLDARALDKLFGECRWPRGVAPSPYAHRVNFRFGDTLPAERPVWLLMPEISYHSRFGTEVMTRIIAMCRGYGVQTAAVFYDLIPLRHSQYQDLAARHSCYVTQLARCDFLFAISHFARRTLVEYFTLALAGSEALSADLASRVLAAPLGEADHAISTPSRADAGSRDIVLLLGTVEPRKGQVRVLESLGKLPPSLRERVEIHVVGALHPSVEAQFRSLVASSRGVRYHGYVGDARMRELFDRARFTIFASEDEGFGLPIAESLAHGVPCLTANFGAMAEVARGGGCFTIDVRSSRELAESIARLVRDDALIDRLRREIAGRSLRTWREYAATLANELGAAGDKQNSAEKRCLQDITSALSKAFGHKKSHAERCEIQRSDGISIDLAIDAGGEPDCSQETERGSEARDFRVFFGDGRFQKKDAERATLASLCVLDGKDVQHALIRAVAENGCKRTLPDCLIAAPRADRVGIVGRTIAGMLSDAARRDAIARRERVLRSIANWRPDARDPTLPLLSIVISTYNRGRFVEENVRLLLRILPEVRGDVRLAVLDNASTDDTLERLAKFGDNTRLTVISNPVNLGMLGNLRACSVLVQARHVWITGDDDFITPAGLADVVDGLTAHPEVPFVFLNFGVYRRMALAENDTAQRLIAEHIPLAAKPVPSGLYPVKRICEQHDNFFTAFYPIVFRSDLLAACFDYPFDGKPFVNLVESVPTTKMILEAYADTDAYWCARIGTVGNIANSWSRHLPRWHAVLMPQVFQLARRVGVDPVRLHQWARLHIELFREAEAAASGAALDIEPAELDVAHQVFQQPLVLA